MKKVLALVVVLASVLMVSGAFARGRSGGSGRVHVRSHVTRSGRVVQGHYRTPANQTKRDNWSSKPNVNPMTGKRGTRNP